MVVSKNDLFGYRIGGRLDARPTPYLQQQCTEAGKTNQWRRVLKAAITAWQMGSKDIQTLQKGVSAAYQLKDYASALELLLIAANALPESTEINFEIALLYERLDKLVEAAQSFEQVVNLESENYLARLHLSGVLNCLGRKSEAAKHALLAVRRAQSANQWRNVSSTPKFLLGRVKSAIALIASSQCEVAELLISPFETQFGLQAVKRVRRVFSNWIAGNAAQPKDLHQKPKYFYFPDLTDTPFLPRALTPWIAALESHASKIEDEARLVYHQKAAFQPFLELSEHSSTGLYLANANEQPRWDAYFFFRNGQKNLKNLSECPNTAEAVSHCPTPSISGHSPEVCFSVLSPGTQILPHYGDSNIRSVLHLALVIPEGCCLVAGGESRVWKKHQAFLFDDTFLHEAWNNGSSERIVLLMDVWHPQLSEVERHVISQLLPALGL